ncbi:MAG: hypothetical protein JXR05_05705 [Flavobacteriaceae bacterium]
MKQILLVALLLVGYQGFSQEEENEGKNNLQIFTPSKLLNKGQWDIKFFNGLYTQTRQTGDNNSTGVDIPRQTFFTSTLEVFTGVSENNRVNLGVILEYRSNTLGGQSTFSVFNFEDSSTSRNGLSTIAPAIKIQPFKSISNLSVQTALHIPTFKGSDNTGVFLDQSSWVFQNRYFYDYTFPSGKWQLFTELNTEYSFGDKDSFANKSLLLAPGVFMSYFPTQEATILGFVQHSERVGGNFQQNSSSVGFGGKYQLTKVLNIETLYSKIVRGNNFQGLGNTFSIGLRALF